MFVERADISEIRSYIISQRDIYMEFRWVIAWADEEKGGSLPEDHPSKVSKHGGRRLFTRESGELYIYNFLKRCYTV